MHQVRNRTLFVLQEQANNALLLTSRYDEIDSRRMMPAQTSAVHSSAGVVRTPILG